MSGSVSAGREQAGGWRAVARRLWQRPAVVRDRRQKERRVEFLELFFDLVFVVLVAQLAHRLAGDVSWSGFGWFAFLFLAVWASWVNGTYYIDAHGTNDISIRVLTFAQMLTVATMAVFIGDVPGSGAVGFALAYAANSALLTVMWFRTGYHDPGHRQNAYPYTAAYGIGTGIFIVSAFVAVPTIYWLWGVALIIQAAAAIPSIRNWRLDVDGTIATPSLIERLGLFVIIVLGEVVASAIRGMAGQGVVDVEVIVVGLLGILVAVGLWWLYFDFVSRRPPRPELQFGWIYMHFPLLLGIAAVGAGVLVLIEQVGEPLSTPGRWLLVGSVALALAANLILTRTLEARQRYPQVYRTASIGTWISIVLVLLLGLTSLDSQATLGALAALLLVPIALSVVVWLRTADAASMEM